MDDSRDQEVVATEVGMETLKVRKRRRGVAIVGVVFVSILVGLILYLLSSNLLLSMMAGLVFGLMLSNLALVYLSRSVEKDRDQPDRAPGP